jgi:hypothetical protein
MAVARRVPRTDHCHDLLLTRHTDESRPDHAEAAQFHALHEQLLHEFAPDQLIADQEGAGTTLTGGVMPYSHR